MSHFRELILLQEETIWLTQKQIAELFEVTIPNISMHIKAIYKENELDKNPTVKKCLTVQKEGNREVSRELEHYNLDVIISVGYRVNSLKATKFRQWATSVLKSYITDRFLIVDEKEVSHMGESLKDLGKKWFRFSKMDSESFEMMGRLK